VPAALPELKGPPERGGGPIGASARRGRYPSAVTDERSLARQIGLLLIAFLATFVLLGGGWVLLERVGSRDGARGSGAPSPTPVGRATPIPSAAASSAGSGSPSSTGGPGASGEIPTVVLLGAGDIGRCGSEGAAQTADIMAREDGSIFTLGDNAYDDGTAAEFAACYEPTWGRVKDRTILPVAGNHDWNTSGAAGYLGYFGSAAAPAGTTWYSKDLGAWHVVVLDSDCDKVGGCAADSPQGRWLAADLQASQARCTLALWHHPRFSSGQHGDDERVAPFWGQLHDEGTELVVNGHDHDYERFAPQDPAGAEERPGGIRELVVGTGGAELRSFERVAPNSEFRHSGTYGVVRLTLHPFNYDWEFLPVSGDIADSGSAPCH
jgi:acid phosphatase type 7